MNMQHRQSLMNNTCVRKILQIFCDFFITDILKCKSKIYFVKIENHKPQAQSTGSMPYLIQMERPPQPSFTVGSFQWKRFMIRNQDLLLISLMSGTWLVCCPAHIFGVFISPVEMNYDGIFFSPSLSERKYVLNISINFPWSYTFSLRINL